MWQEALVSDRQPLTLCMVTGVQFWFSVSARARWQIHAARGQQANVDRWLTFTFINLYMYKFFVGCIPNYFMTDPSGNLHVMRLFERPTSVWRIVESSIPIWNSGTQTVFLAI